MQSNHEISSTKFDHEINISQQEVYLHFDVKNLTCEEQKDLAFPKSKGQLTYPLEEKHRQI